MCNVRRMKCENRDRLALGETVSVVAQEMVQCFACGMPIHEIKSLRNLEPFQGTWKQLCVNIPKPNRSFIISTPKGVEQNFGTARWSLPTDCGGRGLFQVLGLKDHVLFGAHLDDFTAHQTELLREKNSSQLREHVDS